jgi:hypothetical protein
MEGNWDCGLGNAECGFKKESNLGHLKISEQNLKIIFQGFRSDTIQVVRLKTVRKKRILKPCLMQESDISAKVRQSCLSDPFSLQSKQLQPDYVSSYLDIRKAL